VFVFLFLTRKFLLVENNAIKSLDEPLFGILLVDTLTRANVVTAALATVHTVARALEHHVEIKTEDTNCRIVLHVEIDMLVNTKTKVATVAEVHLLQLVLLDLETLFEDLHGLGATHGAVDGDLFVATDTETTDCETGLGLDRLLARELVQDLPGTSEDITRATHRNVKAQLLDGQVAHGVFTLLFLSGLLHRTKRIACEKIAHRKADRV